MKKYLLLLSCSLLPLAAAEAYDVAAPLEAMKKMYTQDFRNMDTNKDGVVSEEEFLSYQFKTLRAALNETETAPKAPQPEEAAPQEEAAPAVKADNAKTLNDVTETLASMAEYELEDDEPLPPAETLDFEENLTLDDGDESLVEISEEAELPELDIELAETEAPAEMVIEAEAGDNLKNLLQNMTEETETEEVVLTVEPAEITTPAADKQSERIKVMLNMVKKTLPKKIDDITTWVDVSYENNEVAYIYQADVDVTQFSDKERSLLTDSIKSDACTQAYTQMCPKIKPMFIDKGVSVKIKYQDKSGVEISYCEMNAETCK